MDLQEPASKMSTTSGSDAGLVYIDDEPDDIRRKFKRAQTDSGSEVVRAPDKPGISNLIEILAVTRGVPPEDVEREFAGQGYGAFKEAVGEAVVELLAPVRERYLRAARRRGRRSRPRSQEGAEPRPLDRHRRDGGRPRAMGVGPRRLG